MRKLLKVVGSYHLIRRKASCTVVPMRVMPQIRRGHKRVVRPWKPEREAMNRTVLLGDCNQTLKNYWQYYDE